MPVLEVHGEVAVHLPAPPLTLDLRLHLQGATGPSPPSNVLSDLVRLPPALGPAQTGTATSSRAPPAPKLQLAAPGPQWERKAGEDLTEPRAHVTAEPGPRVASWGPWPLVSTASGQPLGAFRKLYGAGPGRTDRGQAPSG